MRGCAEAPSRVGAGGEGPERIAEGDDHARLVLAMPPPPPPAMAATAAEVNTTGVPVQTRPWARSPSPIPWVRLVVGLVLLVLRVEMNQWKIWMNESMIWEARSFVRPVLAIVIIASLALFPVVFLPSGPAMWLTGIISGYGFGFLIIMAGITIGMSIPYWIGSLFREHLNGWLEKRWP